MINYFQIPSVVFFLPSLAPQVDLTSHVISVRLFSPLCTIGFARVLVALLANYSNRLLFGQCSPNGRTLCKKRVILFNGCSVRSAATAGGRGRIAAQLTLIPDAENGWLGRSVLR